MKLFRFNSKGFSLTEVMVAVGISGVVIAASTAALQSHLKTKGEENFRVSLIQLKQQIIMTIRNNNSWDATKAGNSSQFSCLQTECEEIDPQVFTLYSAPGVVLVPNLPTLGLGTSGFTINGVQCNTFPTDPCVAQVQVRWRPLCKDYPCRGELAQESIDIIFKVADHLPQISTQPLTVYNYMRLAKAGDFTDPCSAAGMIYAPQGWQRSDGTLVAADANGCVDDEAVVPTPPPCDWDWQETNRTACSAACGDGTTNVTFSCNNTNPEACGNTGTTTYTQADPLGVVNCGEIPPTTQACNLGDCPPLPPCVWQYSVASYGACSTDCGAGTRQIFYKCDIQNQAACGYAGPGSYVAGTAGAETNCGARNVAVFPNSEGCVDNSNCAVPGVWGPVSCNFVPGGSIAILTCSTWDNPLSGACDNVGSVNSYCANAGTEPGWKSFDTCRQTCQ